MIWGKKEKRPKTQMAFGKVLSYCKYELLMERYRSASDYLRRAHRGREGLRVLDVGSGGGHLKIFCDFGNIEWHGVDVTDKAMERCAALGYEVRRVDLETEPLPYDDESFDVVSASHLIEHLDNREGALREMDRVLKAGGLMILAGPIKLPLVQRFLNYHYKDKPLRGARTKWRFSLGSFKELLRRSLDGRYRTVDLHGTKLISARHRRDWENHLRFYKFNMAFGRLAPFACQEIILAKRKLASRRQAVRSKG